MNNIENNYSLYKNNFYLNNNYDILESFLEKQITQIIKSEFLKKNSKISNPQKIYDLFIKITKFKNYITLYNFTKEEIISCFKSCDIIFIKKNSLLFYQDTKPEFYYFLLSGTISYNFLSKNEENKMNFDNSKKLKIQRRKTLNLNNDFIKNKDKIKKYYSFGEFFSKKCIFNNYNDSTAIALENSYLLKIDLNTFEKIFQNKLLLAKNTFSDFIQEKIKFFKLLKKEEFNEVFYRLKFILPITNEIISKENNKNKFFLIYKGNFSIVSNNNKTVLYCSKGDFLNLESLFGINDNIYKFINKSQNSILIEFDLNLFNKSTIKLIQHELIDIFEQKKINVHSQEKNIKFNNEIKKKHDKITIEKIVKKNIEKIQNKIIINEHLIKLKTKNKFTLDKIKLFNIKNLYNKNNDDYNSIHKINSLNNINNNKIKKVKSRNFQKLIKNYNSNKNLEFNTYATNFSSKNSFLSFNNNVIYNKTNSNNNKKLFDTELINTNNYNSLNNSNNRKKFFNEKNKSLYNYSNDNDNQYNSVDKIFNYNNKNKIKNLKLGFDSELNNNIKSWRLYLKDKNNYETHKFDLPLYIYKNIKKF